MLSEPLLALHGVGRVFDGGRVVALYEVDLSIHAGEFVSLVGPSGCGKSTLLHLLGTLDEPDTGHALFCGKKLAGPAARSRFRSSSIGFVFQSFHLLPTLTALENVQIPMFEMPWNRKERRLRAEALLSEVGLENRMGHLPSELSGGERQRVAVARSLANNPQAIIADEPTGNLDSASAAGVIELLGRLHRERSTTLVIATHDMTITQYAKRVVTMRDGKIASDQIVGA
jgi:putative ABC transport system ATP-binding protein